MNNNSINNSNNNNNNNNNNNIRENSELFNIVLNNIYLNKNIFDRLKISKWYSGLRRFNSISSLREYKAIDYLKKIKLKCNEGDESDLQVILPGNIEELILKNVNQLTVPLSIPNWITSLTIEKYDSSLTIKILDLLSNSNRLDSLVLLSNLNSSGKKTVLDRKLPITIEKKLVLNNCIISGSGSSGNSSSSGIISNSLKNLQLLNCDIDSNCSFILPEQLIKFKFRGDCKLIFNQSFKLPSTIQVLKLSHTTRNYDYVPSDYQFPSSLTSLELDMVQLTFKLPSTLVSLKIGIPYIDQFEFTHGMLPSSLTSLDITTKNLIDSNGDSILPPNLLKLTVSAFNNNFKPLLETNVFPPSLTRLELLDFVQFIGVGVLPNSLKILKLSKTYSRSINADSIPFELELLDIPNLQFDCTHNPIILNNPRTLVDCWSYCAQFNTHPQDIISYRVSRNIGSLTPIFVNAVNMEYLDLTNFNTNSIYLDNSDLIIGRNLPPNNKIKTLVIGPLFNKTIQLSQFKQLETIIINNNKASPIIKTDSIDNLYSLQSIRVPIENSSFIDSLDPIFNKLLIITK